MQAVWYVARATLRSRQLSLVVLALAVGLIGGIALASVAGASRGRHALPELIEFHRRPDAFVFAAVDPESPTAQRWKAEIAELPYVRVLGEESFALMAMLDEHGEPIGGAAGAIGASSAADEDAYHTIQRLLVLDGRLPDREALREVAVDEDFADRFDVGVGDRFGVRLYGPEQLEDVGNARPVDPSGADVELEITAIVRTPLDVLIDTFNAPGTLFEVNRRSVYTTLAFWRAHGDGVANYGVGASILLEDPSYLPQLREDVAEITGDQAGVDNEGQALSGLGATQRSIDLEANALIAFGALVALVGLVLAALTVGRQAALAPAERRPQSAVGLTRPQQLVAAGVQPLLVAAGGGMASVVTAWLLSPLTPIGLARRAELRPGFELDPAVLVPGGIVVGSIVLGVALVTIAASLRRLDPSDAHEKPSRLCELLAGAGAPVAAVTGVRMVADPGRRDRAIPARSTIAVAVLGVGAVVAAAGVAQSLDHLVTTPELWGWGWDVAVGNYSEEASADEAAAALEATPEVERAIGIQSTLAEVDDRTVSIASVDDDPADPMLHLVEGSIPTQPLEIAVGRQTLDDLGRDIGETVIVEGSSGERAALRIVGVVTPPAPLVIDMSIGEGGVVTTSTMRRLAPPGLAAFPVSHLVRFRADVSLDEGIAALRGEFADTIVQQTSTPDVESLRRVRQLPYLLAALLAVLAAGALVHMSTTAARRRRHDLGVLKSIGFDRAQVRATMAWQATTVAVMALLVGVPLGLVAARLGWRAIAASLGADLPIVVPILVAASAVPAVIALANLAAARPARLAANDTAAAALRVE